MPVLPSELRTQLNFNGLGSGEEIIRLWLLIKMPKQKIILQIFLNYQRQVLSLLCGLDLKFQGQILKNDVYRYRAVVN